jgi:hypothetical protein
MLRFDRGMNMTTTITKKKYEALGAQVRAGRERKNLTMAELSELAFGSKNQKGAISSLESGTGSISREKAALLIKHLARDEEDARDFWVAFAAHSGEVSVRGLDKPAIQRVIEFVAALEAEAKARPKKRKAAGSDHDASREAGGP